MRSNVEQLPAILPPTSRLLSSRNMDQSHPPIYLKLNSSALELLSQGNEPPEVSLSLSDNSTSLHINNLEFRGSHSKESGYVEVYVPAKDSIDTNSANEGEFWSRGQISSRITIKQGPERTTARSSSPKASSEIHGDKIAELLAFKAHSVEELSSKSQIPEDEVRKILNRIAQPHTGDLFILKNVAVSQEPDTSIEEEPKIKKDQGTQTSHSRGLMINRDGKRAIKRKATQLSAKSALDEAPHQLSVPSLKSQSTVTSEKVKRIKKSEKTADMFELARKFRDAYGEYLELYSILSKRKTRPASQVQKLMAMHNQLAQWKKTLWSNARSKSQVQ